VELEKPPELEPAKETLGNAKDLEEKLLNARLKKPVQVLT
jgi:hypothetical protein